MNTIEQAREASMRLKRYGYDDLALLSISTIDALIAELNDEHMRCAQADNAVEQMAAELVRYKANAITLQELHDKDMVEFSAMTAELASIKGQKPVAWGVDGRSYQVQQVHGWGPDEGKPIDGQYPLFRAAGAQPVQQGPLFWYRPCSDGGYEGPISNGSIEDVRKRSGAWIPLVAAPVQAQPVPDVTKDSIRAAGGIVHSDGNVFFTNINQIKAMLATAPVQEQDRKPLTDAQIYAIWPYPEGTNSVQTFARAIEAAHGIKEQP